MTTTNVSSTHTYTPGYDSGDDQEIDKKLIYGLVACNIFTSLLGILGNALVFVVVFKTQGVASGFRYLISTLAAADLTIGLLVQPLFVVLIIGRRSSDDLPSILFVCRIVGNFGLLLSTITVTLIAMDRCLKLTSAKFNNKDTMTKEKKVALASALGFVCVSSFPRAFLYRKTTLYFSTAVNVVCFVTMIVCYTVICYQVSKHRPFSHSGAAKTRADREEEIQAHSAVDRVSQLQFVRTVGMVLLTFLIGRVLPHVYQSFTGPEKDYGQMYFTTVTAGFCCSAVNPAFYCFDNKRYRKTFKKLLRSLTLRKTERTYRENHSSEISAGTLRLQPILHWRFFKHLNICHVGNYSGLFQVELSQQFFFVQVVG